MQQKIRTYFLNHLKRSTGFIREFQTLFDILNIIKKEKPDVLHLNSTKTGGLGGIAARVMNVPSVYTVHGLILNEPLNIFLWTFYWLLEKIAFAACNKIMILSTFDEQSVLQFHLAPKSKLSLVPLTIDPEQLNFLTREEARNELNHKITENTKTQQWNNETMKQSFKLQATSYKLIGIVANFYPTKDLATLIDAAKIVVVQKPEAKFLIIGDGPLRDDLALQVTRYRLRNHVFLLGRLENASQYLPGFDLFVLSSVKEGLPQVLQEATAAGIPIVSTNVGGIPDLIAKHSTYPWITVPPKSPELLASKILFALSHVNRRSPKSKETLQKEFQQFVQSTKSIY